MRNIEEFGAYIEYCRNLKFEDRPNYEYLKNLFRDLYFKHYEKWDMEYDWLLPEVNAEWDNRLI